jgi:hypothetical protein
MEQYAYKSHRLDVPTPYIINQSREAFLYNEAFLLVRPYMTNLLKKGFKKEEIGDYLEADEYFVQANYFSYIINYLFIIYRYKERIIQNPYTEANPQQIADRFKVECVYKGLSCLGCGEPLQKAFTDIGKLFELGDVFAKFRDNRDCVGLGEMIINHPIDNKVFNVGDNCYLQELQQGITSSFDTPSYNQNSFD